MNTLRKPIVGRLFGTKADKWPHPHCRPEACLGDLSYMIFNLHEFYEKGVTMKTMDHLGRPIRIGSTIKILRLPSLESTLPMHEWMLVSEMISHSISLEPNEMERVTF